MSGGPEFRTIQPEERELLQVLRRVVLVGDVDPDVEFVCQQFELYGTTITLDPVIAYFESLPAARVGWAKKQGPRKLAAQLLTYVKVQIQNSAANIMMETALNPKGMSYTIRRVI